MHATHTPRLKLAVIGAGMASAPHFRSLHDLRDQVELSWVGALTAKRLQSTHLPEGVRTTTRLDDIFEDRSTQAVLLLTPPHTHLELAQRAARAGQHVLMEKPLEVDLARALTLVDSFEKDNLTLAVGSKYYLYEQKYLWGDFAAAAVLSGLPITLVFLAAQRWIVSGLTAGGVKG